MKLNNQSDPLNDFICGFDLLCKFGRSKKGNIFRIQKERGLIEAISTSN